MGQKTVLITGCSKGGIGDALAQEFQRKGLRVFASARNLSKIEHLKALGCDVLPLDVVDDASIKAALGIVKKATGGTLDFLVNNSGSGYNLPLLDTDISVGKQMFDVNVHGLIAVTQAFTPLLIASKGTIINIGSVAGKFPLPWQGYYNATKAAVNLLSDQLRVELKPFGVTVINIVTGGVKTHFFDNLPTAKLPEGSLYAAGREQVEWAMNGGILEKDGTNVDDYARDVVKNALKKSPKVVQWAGSSANLTWFVCTFLWHTVWDIALPIAFKFPNFTPKTETSKK